MRHAKASGTLEVLGSLQAKDEDNCREAGKCTRYATASLQNRFGPTSLLRRNNRGSTPVDVVMKTLGALIPMWVRRRGLFWVMSGKLRTQHIFSGFPPITDP